MGYKAGRTKKPALACAWYSI